jgi:hypothetical protein
MITAPTPAPALPAEPARFRTTVHGTIFGGRDRHLATISPNDHLLLIPDPPLEPEPAVWVHLPTGDPLGHLPPEIAVWLAPWISGGGRTQARVLRIRGPEAPSWRRLLIEVSCQRRGEVGQR